MTPQQQKRPKIKTLTYVINVNIASSEIRLLARDRAFLFLNNHLFVHGGVVVRRIAAESNKVHHRDIHSTGLVESMAPLGSSIADEIDANLSGFHDGIIPISSSTFSLTVSKRTPNVSFSPIVYVGTTLHLHEFSDEEYSRCWVSSEEYEQQKRFADLASELYELFGLLTRASSNDDDGVCVRGLEWRTPTAVATYSQLYL